MRRLKILIKENSISKEESKPKIVSKHTAFIPKYHADFMIWSRSHPRIKKQYNEAKITFMLITNRPFSR